MSSGRRSRPRRRRRAGRGRVRRGRGSRERSPRGRGVLTGLLRSPRRVSRPRLQRRRSPRSPERGRSLRSAGSRRSGPLPPSTAPILSVTRSNGGSGTRSPRPLGRLAGGLLKAVKEVERRGGRRPTFAGGPREIDVDILDLGGVVKVQARPDSSSRHPSLPERRFVLAPLAEIAPLWASSRQRADGEGDACEAAAKAGSSEDWIDGAQRDPSLRSEPAPSRKAAFGRLRADPSLRSG